MKFAASLSLLVVLAVFGLVAVVDVVDAKMQTRVESFPLADNVPIDCDTILDTHTFSGTCCALNTTAGQGCVVNVVNGNCVVCVSLCPWLR